MINLSFISSVIVGIAVGVVGTLLYQYFNQVVVGPNSNDVRRWTWRDGDKYYKYDVNIVGGIRKS